jgi:nucleotide-binding universal stress UspA family protein
VWHGDPAQTIVNAVERAGVGLVAMTTHGRRGLDRLRFGSVAESVVRKAPVPVLLVRGHVRWPANRPPRILAPVDGSERSAAIIPLIARLGRPLHAVVELLHVLPALPPVDYEVPSLPRPGQGLDRAAAMAYLEHVGAPLAAQKLTIECVALDGLPATVITRHAAETGVDLVAMTTHGRSGVARLLVGSVAEQVLRTTDVPVLLWKAPVDGTAP